MPPPRPVGLRPVPLRELAALVDAAVSVPGSAAGSVAGSDPSAADVAVSGISLRTGSVRPGDVFAALPGSAAHGASFAARAIADGAVAIVTDPAGYAALLPQFDTVPPVVIVDEPRATLGTLAARIYDYPSRRLDVIGVTGTSGKTTSCYLIEAALAAAGCRAGLIGTVVARIDGQALPSALTTPEAPDLQALFAVMVQRGATAVAMEVSSHALALGRVAGVEFAVAAFTNLSQDHLDFHGDMESYFAAKRLLFDGRARAEVVVIDDDYGRRLAAARPAARTVSGLPDGVADWTVRAERGRPGVQEMTISGPAGRHLQAQISLPGAFNVTNAVTALACVAAAGVDPAAAAPGLAAVQVPGRMERVDVGQPFLAIVDYAHKPAALAAVLDAVREHCAGRVIAVVGAGGDRDHGKRPVMGAVAARGADLVIVTDDNPRSEEPAVIRAQILSGASDVAESEIREIGDRREAIRAAVAAARPGDVVLVAGKGHEQGQEIDGVVHPFSDTQELAAALTDLVAQPGRQP
ncbi:MAG: UDP-N-acetylmuramoyl-L-alanyl-D-glutamate--2,6-diaminopimelate ligase [Actinobacteria bacterium 69-20]|nr:UDP-N-acetylmuramoyl-L-alanyl-D-glutamate--2,6-diaminopimelate ligase [Actinomycetota bacterium]OJV25839.1 MAG: UDP-N-acetylmuramoyl-L-alanyl-D-glutamate--2,6-diaminopimelate ligase [Actinobacteria bacterium 69-20]